MHHLDINPSELLMIGNSLKSDVLPLIKLDASAIHITWQHEKTTKEEQSNKYKTVSTIIYVLEYL